MTQFINKPANPLHVLVIPAWMPSLSDPASGMFIMDQAVALKKEGKLKVGILFQDPALPTQDTFAFLKAHEISHVIAKRSYIPKASGLLIRLWCRQYFKVYLDYCERFGTPHILHAHSYVAGFAASYISTQTGISFVLTEHSTNFLTGRIRWTHRASLRKVLESATRVFVVGGALAAALGKWTNTQLVQLPNPVDQDLFFYDSLAAKSPVFTVIAIGSLIQRKRIDILLRAIALCQEVKLIIIGSGIEEHSLKLLSRSLGVAPRTTWRRFLSSTDLAGIFKSGHLLVSASDTETFGIVVVEAMMCGLPVICTTSGGPEEFVTEKHGLILKSLASPEEIAAAIEHVRLNYTQYAPREIASDACGKFSRTVVIPKLLGHYQEILNQS